MKRAIPFSALLGLSLLASAAWSVERRILEAEEFDGLMRYPYFCPDARRPDVEITVVPGPDGVHVAGGEGVRAAMSTEGQTYTVEMAVPLALVTARPPVPGDAIGFDVLWTDADPEGDHVAVSRLRWAGGSRTMGQMFFGN